MKFIFLGNKMPQKENKKRRKKEKEEKRKKRKNKIPELNEQLRTFKCSALGGNLLKRQEEESVLYLGFRGLALKSSYANH